MNAESANDQALRTALRQSLQDTPAPDGEALQARVMAQWQQRHPAAMADLAGVGGAVISSERANRHTLWWLAGGLLLAAVLALGWANRPDPALEDLMQPDVLSQMGLGEL